MGLIMIKLKKILKEGYVWDRKFGEPLPTLNSILKKANEDHSGCTEDVCTCEDVNERKVKMTKHGTIHVSEVPSYQKDHYPTQKHWDYYQSLPKGKKHLYYKKYPDILAKTSKQTDDFIAQQKKELGLESVNEGPDDKREARRVLSKIAKTEQKFRKEMFKLEQVFLQDPRTENKKAARDLKKSYKDGVTAYMRDAVQMIKRMK